MKTNILFSTQLSEEMKQKVNNLSGKFFQGFSDGSMQVYVKEIQESERSLEAIRNLAGTISRALQKDHIIEATIDEQALHESFTNHSLEEVITAFVEGWDLGAYDFDKYKSTQANKVANITFAN